MDWDPQLVSDTNEVWIQFSDSKSCVPIRQTCQRISPQNSGISVRLGSRTTVWNTVFSMLSHRLWDCLLLQRNVTWSDQYDHNAELPGSFLFHALRICVKFQVITLEERRGESSWGSWIPDFRNCYSTGYGTNSHSWTSWLQSMKGSGPVAKLCRLWDLAPVALPGRHFPWFEEVECLPGSLCKGQALCAPRISKAFLFGIQRPGGSCAFRLGFPVQVTMFCGKCEAEIVVISPERRGLWGAALVSWVTSFREDQPWGRLHKL